jgi:single-strand DNA-binding protein
MNNVTLIGNLGKDPELKTTTSGKSVVSFSLATQGGGKDAPADWHTVEAWDKTAELVAQYLKKGSKCAIMGRIKYEKSEKDGVVRYFTKIVANNVEFLGGKAEAAEEDPF